MSRHNSYDVSQGLEHHIAQNIERMVERAKERNRLKREILSIRRARKQMEAIPDDVKEWFAEVEGLDDED